MLNYIDKEGQQSFKVQGRATERLPLYHQYKGQLPWPFGIGGSVEVADRFRNRSNRRDNDIET